MYAIRATYNPKSAPKQASDFSGLSLTSLRAKLKLNNGIFRAGEIYLEAIFAWVINNKEWLFSGVGIVLFAWLGRVLFRSTLASSEQIIRSGDGSNNVQAGRDANVRMTKKGSDVE